MRWRCVRCRRASAQPFGRACEATTLNVGASSPSPHPTAQVKVILTGRGKSSIASLVKQEVNMLARLAHPALLRLHGVCFTGMQVRAQRHTLRVTAHSVLARAPQTFIVTEYMDRGSLLDIYRGTPRPEPLDMHICQSAEALAVLFSGLAYLHQQRPPMIHR